MSKSALSAIAGGSKVSTRSSKYEVGCSNAVLTARSKQTHQRLRNLTKTKKEGDSASTHTSECAICLMSIAVSVDVLLNFGSC